VKPRPLHDWDVDCPEAIEIQRRLARRVLRRFDRGTVWTVAGADVGYDRAADRFHAAVLVFRFPRMELLEQARASLRPVFPYVPGLLTFREAPVLLAAFERIRRRPSVVFFDGQGIAHPRRLGLASHVGLLLDVPSVGVAKSRLCGTHDEPGPAKGDWTPLTEGLETIGRVLRTRPHVKPLFISIGHRMDLPTACRLVLACCGRFRQPEPTRQAHLLVTRLRQGGAG
jgi:deoxyribonuclease V